ncbi:MAG: RsmD family RNA methyltransferase [Chitinophagaceae bacterium]|nr:RsmD family RNA methyltransferase [Oligoflexus sp.]
MSLRLTTGFCSGMSLQSPAEGTRPTSGKVRSAVMNSLQMRLPGARLLDAFAGSGAVGIEALSRGAALACFVESNAEALKALRVNLSEVERRAKTLSKTPTIRIFAMNAAKALSQQTDASFDILWFDPPYAALPQQWPLLVPELPRITAKGGLLVVESDESGAGYLLQWSEREANDAWTLTKQKAYGKIAVSFFERRGDV